MAAIISGGEGLLLLKNGMSMVILSVGMCLSFRKSFEFAVEVALRISVSPQENVDLYTTSLCCKLHCRSLIGTRY